MSNNMGEFLIQCRKKSTQTYEFILYVPFIYNTFKNGVRNQDNGYFWGRGVSEQEWGWVQGFCGSGGCIDVFPL